MILFSWLYAFAGVILFILITVSGVMIAYPLWENFSILVILVAIITSLALIVFCEWWFK